MFWGLVLEPSKSYAQVVDTPFHVSMAALDLKNSDNQEEASTLILRQDSVEYVLANLSKKHKIFNTTLGLDFDVGEEIEFFVQGQSQVHLTGFLAGDDGDDLDDENEEDENEVEQKLKDIRKAQAAKRKLKEISSGPAKKQRILDESFNDDTDEDDFDIDEDDLDEEAESEDSEGEEEEDSDEDDSEESDAVSPPPKKKDVAIKQKQQQQQQQQQKQANALSPESKKQKKQKQHEKQQQQQGNKQNNQQQQQQQQKNQGNQNSKSPQKNQQPNKTPQKTPQAKTPQGKTPQINKTPQTGNKQQNAKSPQGNDNKRPAKKVLKGGIVALDITEGTGKVATSNKQVGVYYVGRLASNQKEFDKAVSGKPFNFNLGRGEVIRGWDIGVEGMREGGKRKLTIPAKFAYGQSGAPPAIPPNSTLEFEVTLVNVK